MRVIAICLGLLVVGSATAGQYCGNLPRNSSAYYACESLNQQERFEQDRKREQEKQEADRKRDQYFRDLQERDEREKREARERYRIDQDRAERERERYRIDQDRAERERERDREREKQKKAELAADLVPILAGIQSATEAVDAGQCDQAQKHILEARQRIQLAKPVYYNDGKELRRDLRDMAILIQAAIYAKCVKNPEQKILEFLERESKDGGKVAEELAAKLKSEVGSGKANSQSKKSWTGKIPRIGDYGTDMMSLRKYNSDLSQVPEEACREAAKKKNPDGVYCAYQYETGKEEMTILREAAKLGHPLAQNDLAMKLGDQKESSAEVVRLIKSSASKEIPHAQVTMGWWYMKGWHNFTINYVEAMKWNLKAYKQGHSEGANNIGELYENGLGVTKDIEQAKSWYRKASVLGNAEATERLEQLK